MLKQPTGTASLPNKAMRLLNPVLGFASRMATAYSEIWSKH
jgi:hypothetical protein